MNENWHKDECFIELENNIKKRLGDCEISYCQDKDRKKYIKINEELFLLNIESLKDTTKYFNISSAQETSSVFSFIYKMRTDENYRKENPEEWEAFKSAPL